MSAINEYMKLIPRAFRNAGKIIEGATNIIKDNFNHLPEDEKNEITRRLVICKTCPFMSTNALNDPAMNYKTDRPDEHCSLCGCNIVLKTSSLESNCGIEAYNQTPSGQIQPLDLKWAKYNKTENNGI